MQSRGVRRPSVCLSVRPSVNFAQIASSTTEMAGSPPNLYTMVPRRSRIQGVLKVKVKGHVTGTLLWFHENRFFSQANGWIATKLAVLHMMVPRRARIQDVLNVKVKIKGHVIRTLLWFHQNRFFSQANGWKDTKLAHDGSQPGLHSRVCSGSRSRSKVTWYGHFCDVTKCLLYSTVSRSVSTCAHFMKHHYTLLPVYKYQAARSNVYKYWNELYSVIDGLFCWQRRPVTAVRC